MLAGVVVVLVNVYYCITALSMHMVDEMEKVLSENAFLELHFFPPWHFTCSVLTDALISKIFNVDI